MGVMSKKTVFTLVILAVGLTLNALVQAELTADYDSSDSVDFNDLALFAQHWLEVNEPQCPADLDDNCKIDMIDFGLFAEQWLIECIGYIDATASSSEGQSYTAEKAVDGDFSTRWSSAFLDNQWLQLDMGQMRNVSGLGIYWENAYADRYNVEVSDDAATWTTVHTDNSADGGYDDITFAPQSIRYIRINCVSRATEYGSSIWEVLIKTDDICTPADEWSLVWSDEFDGSTLNLANWEYMIGDGTSYGLPSGWGNNELQYYTDRPENIYVQDGNLVIVAREESYHGYDYTSARIRSLNKQDFLYGRMEARIKLPTTQGMWPAFWMLPTDSVYGGWAASGEIDIVESVNIADTVYAAIHYGGEWPDNTYSGGSYADGTDFSLDFHTYAIEWELAEIRWYVDGILYNNETSWWSSGGDFPAPFDQLFHFLLNIAVGGNWPGSPDGSTVLPQQMVVDYVRVYQRP